MRTHLNRSPRTVKARPIGSCVTCQSVLLSTEELAQMPRDKLDALLEGDGRELDDAEVYRHRLLRERWSLARQWRLLQRLKR